MKFLLCSSKKNPHPPHGGSSEIPAGSGVIKAKILEVKCEAKLEFLGGGGGGKKGFKAKKKLPWGSMDIFWNYTLTRNIIPHCLS